MWAGKRKEVDRVVLPFQRVEIVNESRATREADKAMPLVKWGNDITDGWRNKLIWGDNKYVLGSLLEQFAGKVDLIYIDPPFATGQDFSLQVDVGDDESIKQPSTIKEKAYRDTWGRGLSSYLQMVYERLVLMRELLAPRGSIYVHLGWQVASAVKMVLDEVFGPDRFVNEIVWKRQTAKGGAFASLGQYGRIHESIFFYSKSEVYTWNQQYTEYDQTHLDNSYQYVDEKSGRRYARRDLTAAGSRRGDSGKPIRIGGDTIELPSGRHWAVGLQEGESVQDAVNRLVKNGLMWYEKGKMPRLKLFLDEMKGVPLQSIWTDIPPVQPRSNEKVNYATQKPTALLERIIKASSDENGLVLDAFGGSGTTAAVAECLKRRWIACDLSRWAIQVTRKRLLDTEDCHPFEVLNLGKYERQYWQGVTFGRKGDLQTALHEYVKFILDLYHAEPTAGLIHIHGQRGGRMIHVGAADAPVTLSEIRDAICECSKIRQAKLDVLGWEWEMGLHDVVEAESKRSGVNLRLLHIPREAMDKRAVEAGDVHFYELAYLEVEPDVKDKKARFRLKNFVISSPDLIPDDVRKKIRKWSDFIDYWAVDFEFTEDVFHNQWQDYRTRDKRDLELVSDWHDYKKTGKYKVLVKVFDIFGNDTTHLLEVRV